MWRLGLIAWLVSSFVCSSVTTYETQAFFYLGLPVILPRAYLPDGYQHTHIKQLSNNVNSLYTALELDGQVVLDVLSGWGANYLPLSKSIGNSGIIVAIEKDAAHFGCLQENSMNKDAWNQTLILHLDPCVNDLEQQSSHTISSVVNSIEIGCPRLIRIGDNEGLMSGDSFNALLGGMALISRCRPYVLIDCRVDDMASATAITEFFALLNEVQQAGEGGGQQQYSLKWFDIEQSLTLHSASGEVTVLKRTTASLLAVPSGQEGSPTSEWLQRLNQLNIQQEEMEGQTAWEGVVDYLSQRRFNSTGFSTESELPAPAGEQLCVDASTNAGAPCPQSNQPMQDPKYIVREMTQFTVCLFDIVPPESLLGALLGSAPADICGSTYGESHRNRNDNATTLRETGTGGDLRAALLDVGLHTLVVPYHFSSAVYVENLRQVAAVHCAKWMHTLSVHLQPLLDAQHGALQELSLILTHTCSTFTEKRLRTLRRILLVRAMTLKQPDLVLDQTGKQTNFPEAQLYETLPSTSRPHLFYQMSEAKLENNDIVRTIDPRMTMSSWFTHQPFEASPDEAVCGEPIWCSHTLEFQRRIHAWQNPHIPRASSAPDLAEQRDPRLAKDWSRSAVTRSCAASKFLVYEPASDKHGIGALMELVAAAFRYAVCLDRILVLNFVGQAHTLLKWRHPGCQGSFLECYFQPITGCVLSTEEITAAPTSTDGYEFDRFPLREQRVLLLKGMPMEGPCVLCHSEWSLESRFFDGLYMGGSYNTSDKMHIKHAVAFRTTVKATWSSQFIRYLLRPRPWLQEAVAQIVLFSMQSPAPLAMSHDISRKYLDINNFPQMFLSLHVRFGMKLAEAVLQPLTRYMDFIARKLPHLRDIFLSTETEAVIATLRAEYPEYRFHALRYPRKEFLDLALSHPHLTYHQGTDYVDEMLFSLANLYVASEAHAFVGTLSSNWCMMIMQLERTRGDGGFEYFSMDTGSAYTTCF